ncbi:MAG: endopeptidase La [Bacteroidales bacterium]|nr:endopeptidase La [Bacteroidales bacterium]
MNNFFENEFNELSDMIDRESDFIPLYSNEDYDKELNDKYPETLPILPLRNTVLFPGVVIPITVGREKSIKLVKNAYAKKSLIGVVAQKDSSIEDPSKDDIYSTGTVAHIMKVLKMPDDSTTIIIQGKRTFEITEMITELPYFLAQIKMRQTPDFPVKERNFKALIESIKDLSNKLIKTSPNIPPEASFAINNIESPVFLINFIASNLNVNITEKQRILEIDDITKRANTILSHLMKEIQVVELKNQIQNKVKTDINKQQRDYLLHQQLKTIQEELGGNPNEQEMLELKNKAKNKKWAKEVEDVFQKELQKLMRMNVAAAEYSVQLNYLETLVELPWNETTTDKIDIAKAQKILDRDHFGLEKVKDRILEHLAVIKLKDSLKSPILCLVGPPGVGKTSLGKSIAEAMGRKYIRMSLGGLRDEAEIRGHRKTYVGAMPGRIIQSLKRIKSANPVFVLDEIDKVGGHNFNGDPSSALLEVLDPEQNNDFRDNFLELGFDLSKVLFIATANTLSTVQPALLDRMEIVDISGYILEEKSEIAKRHLLPKQLIEHGLESNKFSMTPLVLKSLIEDYTRESGVRALEKNIAKIIRNKAKDIVAGNNPDKKISKEDLVKVLGAPRYSKDIKLNPDIHGVVTGLAWTAVGGEILFVEVSRSKGKGTFAITGNMGDVMKESASIAFEYLKAHAEVLDINPDEFEKWHVHIHIPEGATPKDGPSAGITMFAALSSLFTDRRVNPLIAMTGEITLRGKVLPVGGIKEKILAAKRYGYKDIILPKDNKKDILEIKNLYLEGLNFHYIDEMIEVIEIILQRK